MITQKKSQFKSSLNKFIKYTIWWWLAALVDLLLLYILTDYIWLYYLYSQILAFIISFIIWFLFQKHITFISKGNKTVIEGFYFLLFQWIGLCINLLLLHRFVEYIHLHYMIWSILAKGIVLVWNFTMNYYYNFKD